RPPLTSPLFPYTTLFRSDVDVVLVDKHDYHTFQPLLYQVATGLLEQPAVGHPIRDLVHKQPNARVHQDMVTGVDLDAREAHFREDRKSTRLNSSHDQISY